MQSITIGAKTVPQTLSGYGACEVFISLQSRICSSLGDGATSTLVLIFTAMQYLTRHLTRSNLYGRAQKTTDHASATLPSYAKGA